MKKNYTPVKSPVRNPTLFISGFFLYIFITLNIIASQSVPALYFDFISERKDAVAQTLYKIQRTKEYPEVLSMQRAIYGPSIDAAISQENETRFYNIQQLEKILQLNPRARDVFYALGTLYEEQGDASKSGFFFQKAHEIDPSLR